MTKTSPRTPEGRVSAVANGGTINGVYCLQPGDALEAFRRDLLELVERPTLDAYMASNRALNWRNAQLRAHGIEPLDLSKLKPGQLTHYPPEGFNFGDRPVTVKEIPPVLYLEAGQIDNPQDAAVLRVAADILESRA
jgi:hypothetical protein